MIKAKKGYTLVALDFSGQELRLAADDSRDPDFLDCYIGDNKKDPHSLTGLRIHNRVHDTALSYDDFIFKYHMGIEEMDVSRSLGKKINFTCQYGAMAPKVAQTLCIEEIEAQSYINSRAEAFPRLIERVKEWHALCKKRKYATTMMGARRHLDSRTHYRSRHEHETQAADRLAYSMRIQGSAAEQTKMVVGSMYREGIFDDGTVIPMLTIHDEVVLQIKDEVLDKMIPPLIDLMCQPYADMIVPMETDPEVGKNFGTLKNWEAPNA